MPARGAATKPSVQTTNEHDKDEADWAAIRALPLAQKLAEIMGRSGYVQKRGWNDFFRYKYVTEADLVATVRPLMAKAGVIIVPNVLSEVREADVVQERTGTSSLTRVMVEYIVTDGSDSIRFRMPGYGVDRADKGIYKAITGSMKYALMKLFEIETGDDPERDAEEPATDVAITPSSEEGIQRGGRSTKATRYQLQRIAATMREKSIDRGVLLGLIKELFNIELELPTEHEAAQQVILAFLRDLETGEAGALVKVLDEWSEGDDAA